MFLLTALVSVGIHHDACTVPPVRLNTVLLSVHGSRAELGVMHRQVIFVFRDSPRRKTTARETQTRASSGHAPEGIRTTVGSISMERGVSWRFLCEYGQPEPPAARQRNRG